MTIDINDIDTSAIISAYEAKGVEIPPRVAELLGLINEYQNCDDGAQSALIERRAEKLSAELLESDDPLPWQLIEEGHDYDLYIGTGDAALAYASENLGNYEREETIHIDVLVRCPLTGDELGSTIELDPPEPVCTARKHEWCSPRSVLGGSKDDPGVRGHGGGLIIKEVCAHCGIYRETNTWAQNRGTGEQGLTSVAYLDADDVSLAWVGRRAIIDRLDAINELECVSLAYRDGDAFVIELADGCDGEDAWAEIETMLPESLPREVSYDCSYDHGAITVRVLASFSAEASKD